jgi:hypothetical protein
MVRLLPFVAIAALIMALLPGGSAEAEDDPILTLTAPVQGTLGELMTLTATLHEASGAPIAEAPLEFFLRTEILNNRGRAAIGGAVTDADGIATLLHEPRQSGQLVLQVEFAGTDTLADVRVQLESRIVGDRQLFIEAIGTDAPKFEVWVIIAALSVVWLTLVSVIVRIVAIAHASRETVREEEVPDHFRTRKEWS